MFQEESFGVLCVHVCVQNFAEEDNISQIRIHPSQVHSQRWPRRMENLGITCSFSWGHQTSLVVFSSCLHVLCPPLPGDPHIMEGSASLEARWWRYLSSGLPLLPSLPS